jgi:D-beta-D-heptose 7-phosphate kinase/D-beta-D-heptose 1-phosphate adenosyltransferase
MAALSRRRIYRSHATLDRLVQHLKRSGQRVVLTNGCFDLLHVGHIALLERAKRLGDVLVVAVNSDRSVKRLKGPQRPIVPEGERARVLAALACVDAVTLFDEDTPARLIARLCPDVLVKGADWAAGQIIGEKAVRRAGGRVVRIPLVRGRSTSDLIARIRRLH